MTQQIREFSVNPKILKLVNPEVEELIADGGAPLACHRCPSRKNQR
jgi:hypothetical protein